MSWKVAGVAGLLALGFDLYAPPTDACGVKLTIKTSRPRKAVARSSNPSHLLLVGSPPRRLERDLEAAGHEVEVAPSTSAAKRQSYTIVMVSSDEQSTEAHQKFAGAIVVLRTGDIAADVRSVEDRIARKPLRVDEGRTVVARAEPRTPIAATPPKPDTHPIVAVKDTTEATPEPVPAPPPAKPAAAQVKPKATPAEVKPKPAPSEKVATTVTDETPAPKVKPEPAPPAANTTAKLDSEIYFATSSASLKNKAALDKAVRWLTANASVNVVIEGYADPTGTPDANMALSQTRANTVRDYLASAGIDGSRMEVVPYGDTRLKYGKADSRNRRVAIEAKK
jgi:peptidoglycan-associated lipoprotein